ncbi:hypothetical protein ABEB36_010339 [Hypothenemus hampei]|uniref:O-acyltransferase n=1 Tax=Hypothenemus hampei TaxID=57062 RepID=A0ABD1EMA6_HYPHA
MGEIQNKLNENVEVKKSEEKNVGTTRVVKRLPVKKFEIRESLLTTLYENPHIKVIRHIFVASLVALFVNTVLRDFFHHGEIRLGFKVILSGLDKLHLVVLIWICLNFTAIFAYYCFNFWAKKRINFPPKASKLRIWDRVWIAGLLIYYILHVQVICQLISALDLPMGSTAILSLEVTRLLMKVHGFVRSNAEKVVYFKPHSDETLHLADVKHFLYFLFAPTLVYCDSYPRTKTIRKNFVATKLCELIGVIFYYAFLLERFTIPDFKDIGIRQFTIQEVILKVFDNFVIGLMFLLLSFYVVLDTTQNLFAELLKFGDRQFYQDWWTATNYSQYFRSWNMVVGEWLYTYIYKDMYEHVVPGRKSIARISVFLLSAIVHEWILSYMFGFFFPILCLTFCFTGLVLTLIPAPKHSVINILFWYILSLGCGLLSSLYTMEYFARKNSPVENPTLSDFIIPRLLTCNCTV